MSVIEAASVGIKTMADGTLRITADVHPTHAQAAFKLFGSPGTQMALAALKDGHGKQSSEPIEQTPPAPAIQAAEPLKGGELSKWVAMRCNEPAFQAWIRLRHPNLWDAAPLADDNEMAAAVVRGVCGVQSRAHLDHDDAAAQRFHECIRKPYADHVAKRGRPEPVEATA